MVGEPSWAKGWRKPPAWSSGQGRIGFENPWIRVVEYDAVAPTGTETHYGVVRFKNLAVGVFPLHEDGTVTLVGQQRFALPGYSWEMPEGGVPMTEDPLEGARRELAEETGLIARDWREILSLDLSNSVTDERAVCFLARDLVPGEAAPDATEAIEVARVPFRALLDAVAAGQIRDALTVAVTLRVHHMAVSGELPSGLARLMLG